MLRVNKIGDNEDLLWRTSHTRLDFTLMAMLAIKLSNLGRRRATRNCE